MKYRTTQKNRVLSSRSLCAFVMAAFLIVSVGMVGGEEAIAAISQELQQDKLNNDQIEETQIIAQSSNIQAQQPPKTFVVESPINDVNLPESRDNQPFVLIRLFRYVQDLITQIIRGKSQLLSSLFLRVSPVSNDPCMRGLKTINETPLVGPDIRPYEIIGTQGPDQIIGNQCNDQLRGKEGADDIQGGDGNDHIRGNGGNDAILRGGDGDDTIKGGTGDDRILGNDDNDFIEGGSDKDIIEGGSGQDTLEGGDGVDTIFGNADEDTLEGDEKGDCLYGGAGSDTIWGGTGKDFLIGGTGEDYLYGEEGKDSFWKEEVKIVALDHTDFEPGDEFKVPVDLNELNFPPNRFPDLPSCSFDFSQSEGSSQTVNFISLREDRQYSQSGSDFSADFIFDSATGNLYLDSDGRGKKPPRLFATVPLDLEVKDINVDFVDISSLTQAQRADISTVDPVILASLPFLQANVIDVETLDFEFRPKDIPFTFKDILDPINKKNKGKY